jgi:serine/threonine protein kinase
MKLCPNCHSRYDDAVMFCPHDGTVLPDPVDEFLGQRLMGQFDIRERCGQGAMGTVYQAHQMNMDRLVAIKILRQDLVRDRTVVKRFYREAKAAARLSHPNIITVHLVAETDDGLPYIVMEYLEGTDLDTLCKSEAPLSIERSVHIAMQIASALAEAHTNDVIHRDLKPANIIVVEKHRSPDFVKVLDFGIAKILEGGTDESRITKSGAIFGTPYYLSPEQATGAELDCRADLYSLAVILYRLVTGHLPFESGSGLDILVRHVKDPPPPPRLHNAQIPAALEAVILKALEKDREQRFTTAEEMRAALGAVLGDGAVPDLVESREPSAPWARPGAKEDQGKSKSTVFGFSSGAGNPDVVGPVEPEQDPLAQVAKKAIAFSQPVPANAKVASVALPVPSDEKGVAQRESKRTRGPMVASWGNAEGGASVPSGGESPGVKAYQVAPVAPAPAPVRSPTFDPDEGRARAPIPRPLSGDPGLRSAPSPVAASTPRPPDSSPSVVTGEHTAPSDATLETLQRAQDRGRMFTIATAILALVALGVGGFFIARDHRARTTHDKNTRSNSPVVDAGVGSVARPSPVDAAVERRTPPGQVGAALVKVVKQGYTLRLSCESQLRPRTAMTFVLDLWRDGTSQPVDGARIAIRFRAAGRRGRVVKAKAAKVPGRYVFDVQFRRPGKRNATLKVTLADGMKLSTQFELKVGGARPRTRPMHTPGMQPMRQSMNRPMDTLPRLPPDGPMHRRMNVLPRDPPDPPANPEDPD